MFVYLPQEHPTVDCGAAPEWVTLGRGKFVLDPAVRGKADCKAEAVTRQGDYKVVFKVRWLFNVVFLLFFIDFSLFALIYCRLLYIGLIS